MAKLNSNALSVPITLEKIQEIQLRVDNNSVIIDEIVSGLVSYYCQSLDDYISFIREVLADSANPPSDVELDDFTLNIPTQLYFAGEAMESLGIKEDVAKAIKQELYNGVYDQATGTVADKTAVAELATQSEYITHIAYQRAYKKIKFKIEAGTELLQSIKKVISRRMLEYDLSRSDPARSGGNN